jgi:hypothetical protein
MRYAVAILLALTVPASAEDRDSANYILPGCKALLDRSTPQTEAFWRGRCVGILEGLWFGIGGRDFCLPNGVTNKQTLAVVVKYIEARPERMHERFGDLAIEALTAGHGLASVNRWPPSRIIHMDIMTGLSAVAQALNVANWLRGIEKEFDAAEFKIKIADLYSALADAKVALAVVLGLTFLP